MAPLVGVLFPWWKKYAVGWLNSETGELLGFRGGVMFLPIS